VAVKFHTTWPTTIVMAMHLLWLLALTMHAIFVALKLISMMEACVQTLIDAA
jgi:hypothetical protein